MCISHTHRYIFSVSFSALPAPPLPTCFFFFNRKEKVNIIRKVQHPKWPFRYIYTIDGSSCMVKNLPQCNRPGFDPWVGKIPWKEAWRLTPVFLPGEFPWAEEPGRLQSMGWQRVRHESGTKHPHTQFSSVQSLSRVQLCEPMNCRMPGFPVHHQLLEFTQTHAHQVGDAIQPHHPLSPPSPPAPNPSQHQGLLQWVSSSHEVAKVLEFQVQHQSFQWTPRTDLL